MTLPSAGPAAWLDSYRLNLRDSLAAAERDGFRGVLISTTRADLNPTDFGASARRHFSKHLRDRGLTLGALTAPWSGAGLADPQYAEERIAHLRATLELCADLGVRRAVATLGGLGAEQPEDLAAEALRSVAELADRSGVQIAIHGSAADPAVVASHVRRLGCPDVKVAVDTASGALDASSAGSLAGLVGVVQLRDVVRSRNQVEEVEFGAGEVDFAEVLGLLAEAGSSGPLVLRRDAPGAGVDALRRGREYIESLLARSARR